MSRLTALSLLALSLLMLLLCHGSNADNNNKKSYSVLNKTGTFEVRKYPSFKYIVAIEEGTV